MKRAPNGEGIQDYRPTPDDPFYAVHDDPSSAWRRPNALIETVALLDELQNPDSIASMPALVLFIRADGLSWSLRSLGLLKEALQLGTIAHEVIGSLLETDQEAYRGYYAQSLLTLSICRRDMGRLDDAVAASREAVTIYRALAAMDSEAFRSEFARSLDFLSVALGAVGRKDEALAANRESEMIFRALAASNPGTFNPLLASSLNNLSPFQ